VSSVRKVGVITVCLIVAAALSWYFHFRITLPQLRATIERQVPVGTPAPQVLRFLDSLRTEHSEVFESRFESDFPGPGRFVTAAIQDLRRPNLLSDGIFMKFRFDEHNVLVDYHLELGWTFL